LDKYNPQLFADFVRVVETGEPLVRDISYLNEPESGHYQVNATKLGDGFAVTVRALEMRQMG
jgi:hypothetical protein